MSLITEVILCFSILESDSSEDDRNRDVIDRVNKFFELDMSAGSFIIPPHDDWYGGTKCLTTPMFIGAFNYLHLDELVKYLRVLSWKYPESVQLLVKREDADDEKFWDVKVFE